MRGSNIAATVVCAGLFVSPAATAQQMMQSDRNSDNALNPLIENKIDPNLMILMNQAAEDEILSALVYLDAQVDIDALEAELLQQRANRDTRHRTVVLALQEMANDTQGGLLAALQQRQAVGEVANFTPFWISNLVAVDATRAGILGIAQRADVEVIYLDYGIELIAPLGYDRNDANLGNNAGDGGATDGGPEIGIIAVRAPEVWAMGIDGTGVLVANIDTGVDGDHPALGDRWVGIADKRYADNPEWAWHDPVTSTPFPRAFGSHGTHTMGSVTGGLPGRQVGVAPGAFWMASGVIDRESIQRTVQDAILALQWMADPDENPNTSWDVPGVCSNSWGLTTGHGYPPCDETFWEFVDASEAAGTIQLWSAGNEGNSGLRRPADRATTDYSILAVAAVDANNGNWPIASFSSRGPTNCTPDGSQAIKPDIAAPGVNVVSSVDGGGYSAFSGTSMASPHINGVVALMLQANPNLPSDEVKQIMYDTAFDLGSSGEDNSYGWGMVDAFESVIVAISLNSITFEFPDGLPTQLNPNGGTSFRVQLIPRNAVPEPGTATLHYDDGSGYQTALMSELSEDMYEAIFPPTQCSAIVNFYVSVETTEGEVITSPFNAPQSFYSALSVSEIRVAFEDDFESDTGWTVENIAIDGGAWERGVPADGNRGDPPTDADGSGQCYVTGNFVGNSDVDGGPTRLVSPLIDLSTTGDPVITYSRWMYCDTQESDLLRVLISNNAGANWRLVEEASHNDDEEWVENSFRVKDFFNEPSDQFIIRFAVSDNPNNSVTEAGIDAFRIDEFVCSESADLTGFEIVTGTPLGGTLPDLLDSDNAYVHTLSGFGETLIDLHSMEMRVTAVTGVGSPSSLAVSIESRIDEPSGLAQIRMRNWNTNNLDFVGSFPIGNADQVGAAGGIAAANYVDGAGNIEMSMKHLVFVPFIAFDFESFVDHVVIDVN